MASYGAACAQPSNSDPFFSLSDGDSQTSVGFSGSVAFGIRLTRQIAVIASFYYRYLQTQFHGPNERVTDLKNPGTPPETNSRRTSIILTPTIGVGVVWR